MINKLKGQKFNLLQMIATVAIAVATQALTLPNLCTAAVYEPKVPEALKKEMK